ncbi:MAG TPA: hypothetical protein VNP92_23900 [Actinophytocola sp.]|nr:hypothetical protein [Actinophytocola sp.]
MSGDPTASTPTDQDTNNPAPLVLTDITAAPGTAPVTAGEIAEFLHHLTDLRVSGRSADPAARAAFLHRKAELFIRLAAVPARSTVPPAPGRRTP